MLSTLISLFKTEGGGLYKAGPSARGRPTMALGQAEDDLLTQSYPLMGGTREGLERDSSGTWEIEAKGGQHSLIFVGLVHMVDDPGCAG